MPSMYKPKKKKKHPKNCVYCTHVSCSLHYRRQSKTNITETFSQFFRRQNRVGGDGELYNRFIHGTMIPIFRYRIHEAIWRVNMNQTVFFRLLIRFAYLNFCHANVLVCVCGVSECFFAHKNPITTDNIPKWEPLILDCQMCLLQQSMKSACKIFFSALFFRSTYHIRYCQHW